MIHRIIFSLVLLLGIEIAPQTIFAQADCSLLDPRASVSKEREGKISGSVDTLFRIAKAGGSMEGKVKEEIQNLQKGAPVGERDLIKLRTVYLFCTMFANDKDLAPERKVSLFNLMMGIKEQDPNMSVPNPKKKGQGLHPNSTSSDLLSKKENKGVSAEEKKQPDSESSAMIASDFLAYEEHRLRLGNSLQFFTKNAPIHYRIWRKEAEQGNAMAQVLIGRALDVGVGVSEDKAESRRWFERAADSGNSFGQFNLGNTYQFGLGVDSDKAIALAFYEQAAKQGHPGAIRALGDFHRWGYVGIHANAKEAIVLYEKAIALGDTGAMVEAADLYFHGAANFPPNTEQAMRIYKQAATLGNPTAQGKLASREMAELLERYVSDETDQAGREAIIKKTREASGRLDSVGVTGLIDAFKNYKVQPAIEKILNLDTTDSMRVILSGTLNDVSKKFIVSDRATRTIYLRDFSSIVFPSVQNLVDSGKYVDVAEVCRGIYKDLDLSNNIVGEQDKTVRLLTSCISSLFSAGYRAEATTLADRASNMVEMILRERPWDWYVEDNAGGLYFTVGASLRDLNEQEKSQKYLSRAWVFTFNRFGRSDLIGKYAMLPVKGGLPEKVSDADRSFFEKFAKSEKKPDERTGITRFTIPVDFDGTKFPFYVYIITGKQGYKGLQDQFVWLKEYRGGKIPNEVQESFNRLNKIAVDNDVDFRDLCVYALGDKKDETTQTTKSP